MNRREFIKTAGGTAGATAALSATGTAAGQEDGGSGGKPDYGGWFDGVSNFDSTVDKTGSSEVTVQVGVPNGGQPFGFGPAAVHVDTGTTVKWEWTGEGGGHNVVGQGNDLDSGSTVAEPGVHYEYTFEESGIYKYYCAPHQSLGMKGAVVVGDDYPTAGGGGGGVKTVNPQEAGVPIQPHFVGIGGVLAVFASLVFTFYLLKYGESPNTSGGNN
ncbi:MAG: halocyanin domain-containing protein [Haloarculaceae archaeon]